MVFHTYGLLIALALALSVSAPNGHAQETVEQPPPSAEDDSGEDSAPAREAENLDTLFTQLRKEARPAAGRRIARQIWRIWTDSGSDTINLLMEWSQKAIQEKNYGLAADLLDQVTTLMPAFAEGYNRRATLSFLMDDYGGALADIERTLQLEPRHFGALAGLGEILRRTEQDKRALETWYRVLEIYPANEAAQKAIVDLEEKLSGQGI